MVSSIGEQLKKLKISHVEQFLSRLRACIEEGDCTFVDRTDNRNMATMVALGFKTKDVINTLSALKYQDYCSGPEKNTSSKATKIFQDGDIWVFGKVVTGLCTMEVYIKVSFAEIDEADLTCCISFHKPDYKLTYPLV
ncbi:hypothetical protein [Viridibacillus arvi]|uniref:hypothetical protein n=1 Tax=Viridibacillus arvi TaxID=263475 RepID=UPI0034CE8C5A